MKPSCQVVKVFTPKTKGKLDMSNEIYVDHDNNVDTEESELKIANDLPTILHLLQRSLYPL